MISSSVIKNTIEGCVAEAPDVLFEEHVSGWPHVAAVSCL